MKFLILTIVLSCILLINAAPAIFDNDDFFDLTMPDFDIPDISVSCQKDFGCPADATACSRQTSTSADGKEIITEVKCFGSNGQLLGSPAKTVKANPIPGSIQNGYEFHGSSGNVHNSQVGSGTNTQSQSTHTSDVETFDK